MAFLLSPTSAARLALSPHPPCAAAAGRASGLGRPLTFAPTPRPGSLDRCRCTGTKALGSPRAPEAMRTYQLQRKDCAQSQMPGHVVATGEWRPGSGIPVARCGLVVRFGSLCCCFESHCSGEPGARGSSHELDGTPEPSVWNLNSERQRRRRNHSSVLTTPWAQVQCIIIACSHKAQGSSIVRLHTRSPVVIAAEHSITGAANNFFRVILCCQYTSCSFVKHRLDPIMNSKHLNFGWIFKIWMELFGSVDSRI